MISVKGLTSKTFYPKCHILKIPFLTKFTFSKFHFSQNSHFQNSIFHKIHIVKISIFTKFTFFKHQIPGNFRLKSGVLTLFNTFGNVLLPPPVLEFPKA